MFKSGFVAIVGNPNAGKSSLINKIFSRKISIVSDKVQTTRNMIRGVYTDDDSQIIFLDTPGFHKPHNKLQVYMNDQIEHALSSVDVVIYVVDAKYGFGKKEQVIINKIKDLNVNTICLINKIDLLKQEQVVELVNQAQQLDLFQEIFAISLKDTFNVELFLNDLKALLPEGLALYPEDHLVDYTKEFYIEEIVREKINQVCFDEIPHSVAIKTKAIEEDENGLSIFVDVYVHRDSQKGIIIGRGGQNLKTIGKRSRLELKEFFNQPIYLDIHVKVKPNWVDNNSLLMDWGYKD